MAPIELFLLILAFALLILAFALILGAAQQIRVLEKRVARLEALNTGGNND